MWLTQTIRSVQNFPNRSHFVRKQKSLIDQQSKNSFFSSGRFLFESWPCLYIYCSYHFALYQRFTIGWTTLCQYSMFNSSSKFIIELNWRGREREGGKERGAAVIGGIPIIFNEHFTFVILDLQTVNVNVNYVNDVFSFPFNSLAMLKQIQNEKNKWHRMIFGFDSWLVWMFECVHFVVMADMCHQIINWKQQKHQNKRFIYFGWAIGGFSGREWACVNMYNDGIAMRVQNHSVYY